MKTTRLMITLTLIVTGSLWVNMSAQEAIKEVAKKCESLNNIDYSVIRTKDPTTKNVVRVMINIKFKDNTALKNEIIAAFHKDRDMADNEMESRRNGRTNFNYKFGKTSCLFSENNNGEVSFSINENNSDGATILLNSLPVSFSIQEDFSNEAWNILSAMSLLHERNSILWKR